MLPDHVLARFHTPAFRQFLDGEMAAPADNEGFDGLLRHQAVVYRQATLALVYHALATLFDRCPTVKAVRATWTPAVSHGDRAFSLPFALELTTCEEHGEEVGLYGYDDWPESFVEATSTDAFREAIAAGELIQPEMWNEVNDAFSLTSGKDTYRSRSEVLAHMEADLAPFLARVRQWAMDQDLSPARPAPAAHLPVRTRM